MGEHTEIATHLIEAKLLGDGGGYTWTLASQLGKMLRLAELRFGQRDRSYTILVGLTVARRGASCTDVNPLDSRAGCYTPCTRASWTR